MEEAEGGGSYWCHMCSQMVNPILELELVKCPLCRSGFVEQMTTTVANNTTRDTALEFGGSNSDRALSLWAPVLIGMMSNRPRRRRLRRLVIADDDEDDDDDHHDDDNREGETELDRELESILRRRRRRNSASILQLLQGIRAGMLSEVENNVAESETDRDSTNNNGAGGRERVILINPFNQTIVLQGSYNSAQSVNRNHPIGSLGDYFVGPGLELLLQHLAENDPNRYGTPPAQKEAVEALPTVRIGKEENMLQCSVCLDDFEIGTEAKEMPCNHKFHSGCILPWLELHSSCPVCRHQLPADESKLDSDSGSNNAHDNNRNNNSGHTSSRDQVEGEGDGRNGSGRRFSVPLPWPLSSLFSSSTSSASSTNAPGSGSSSRTDEN